MFWSQAFISEDLADWVEDCFNWFDARFAAPEMPILPTRDFFQAASGHDHDTALGVLQDVKRHLAFDLPIELQSLEVLPAEYRHSYQATNDIAGTYQEADGVRLICYDPEQLHRPISFINTIAHEVMHARLSGLEADLPGGIEMHELATDLGCIIAGFGIFQLQSADDAGWSGYLTQPTRAYALACFLDQRGLRAETVNPYLSARCQKLLKRAFKSLST